MNPEVDLNYLEQLVINAAIKYLLPNFTRAKRQHKADGSIVTQTDIDTQKYIQQELKTMYPDIAFMGEEMPDAKQSEILNSNQDFWCLDPIDGTSNFAAGLPFFSISLALLNKEKVKAAVIYDPVRKECFSAINDAPAMLNSVPLTNYNLDSPTLDKSIALVDFKRLDSNLRFRLVQDMPFASQRNLGSIALEWCWLATNRYHVYLHGKQKIWDYAGANLIFSKAGGYSCTLEGDAILDGNFKTRSALAALDKNLFDDWREYLIGKSNV